MSVAVVPLQQNLHAAFKLLPSHNFAEFSEQHLFPLSVHEFVRASTEYPIVWVKDSETGQFRAVLLTGLTPGENLYKQQQQPNYLPLAVRNYPLVLLADPQQQQQFSVGVNTSSALMQQQQGDALFTADGRQTEFLQQRTAQLIQTYEQQQVTSAFTELLLQHDLLQPQSFNIDIKGQSLQLNGIYIINEANLTDLPIDQFADLRQRGFLPAIYAQLTSLHQLNRLAQLKVAQS